MPPKSRGRGPHIAYAETVVAPNTTLSGKIIALTTTGPAKSRVLEPKSVSLSWWFDQVYSLDCAVESEEDGPPRKRARLSEDQLSHSDPNLNTASIPVAHFTLDFGLSKSEDDNGRLTLKKQGEPEIDETVDVGLLGVEDIEQGRAVLRLAKSRFHKASLAPPVIEVEISHSRPQGRLDDLEHVAALERKARTKTKAGLVRAICSLRRRSKAGESSMTYSLEATILWSDGESRFGGLGSKSATEEQIFTKYFPQSNPSSWHSWSPQDFYGSVYAPPVDEVIPSILDRKHFETELYPFQKRAVHWMLRREAVVAGETLSSLSPHVKSEAPATLTSDEISSGIPISYASSTDATGHTCFVSHLQGTIATRASFANLQESKGGILAEEMGLGKTVELISLFCLHKRNSTSKIMVPDGLLPTDATLIVTPLTILQQWKDELSRHAPHLTWVHYEGMGGLSKSKQDESDMLEIFATKDVVLTTYPVLAREVHFATDPPDRNLRQRAQASVRKRSPLVQMHWWRVCLDEAQMVESGVSAAATVAALIPRENAWAVSGTPLRKDVQDLRGLLVFLRFQPFCEIPEIWRRMTNYFIDDFRQVFGRIALRHTKDQIRHELRLPPQRRVVITVPFTAIEEQNYRSLFDEMAYDCGLARDGSPLSGEWNPEDNALIERMRNWLVRLRQTCLHPQVGGRNRRALGRGAGPLRTVAEVLEVMINQNEIAVRSESRACLMTQLLRAHIIANAKDNEHRAQQALELYLSALEASQSLVEEARRELIQASEHEKEDEPEEEERTHEQSKLTSLRANVRSALELQHACAFFVGTSYFQIKSNSALTEEDSDRFRELEQQELEYYERAKVLRKELLQANSAKAENLMRSIQQSKTTREVGNLPDISELGSSGGIESRRVFAHVDRLSRILSDQTELLLKCRGKVIELLLKPLVDREDEETTGEEYEESTKQQDEMYCYFDAYRALVADRSTCFSGQINILVNHEMGTLYKDALEGRGHSPELMISILDQRNEIKQADDDLISIRGLLYETRTLETSLQVQEGRSQRADTELHIVRDFLKQLQATSTVQNKTLAHLEKDQELFRATMNQRLEFYRQLQQISDTVAPYKEVLDETLDVEALKTATAKGDTQNKALATLKTKRRFLLHLRDESQVETQRICVICQSSFEQGVLTVCGHQYCKECIQHWWSQHRTCPVCKRTLRTADFHQITYKPQELRAQQEDARTEGSSSSSSPGKGGAETASASRLRTDEPSIYSGISTASLEDIKSINLPSNTSFGTKVDTLSRHLLHLRDSDPGSKTVIFSQYRDFLSVLSSALKTFNISHVQITQKDSITRFREDPSIEAFLLDAKTDSSGLNLVNATTVMLCEPLVNAAIELQAIARVHRIGQRRATSVFMYLVKDTVEESIYDLSVKRRLEHVQQRTNKTSSDSASTSRAATPGLNGNMAEAAVEKANSLEMQQAPLKGLLTQGKGGGEMVAKDDLWRCLFGKASQSGNSHATNNALMNADVRDVAGNEDAGALGTAMGRFMRAEAAEGRSK